MTIAVEPAADGSTGNQLFIHFNQKNAAATAELLIQDCSTCQELQQQFPHHKMRHDAHMRAGY
jgi:hypothetical protein